MHVCTDAHMHTHTHTNMLKLACACTHVASMHKRRRPHEYCVYNIRHRDRFDYFYILSHVRKQASKQASKQTSKHADKQACKQT